jgi:superoxide dismutase, Fe-Mn family
MKLEFRPLPYASDGLDPVYSQKTLDLHYGKHHRTYFDTAVKLVAGTDLEGAEVEDIIQEASGDTKQKKLFNNAAQHWNHDFFWSSMRPGGGGEPTGEIAELIKRDLKGYNGFREAFKKAAVEQFGSGWAWLVLKDRKLQIYSTGNADNPLVKGGHALLTVDVWEHAYYLDYQNRRPEFLEAFLDKLLNWDKVNERLSAASSAKASKGSRRQLEGAG